MDEPTTTARPARRRVVIAVVLALVATGATVAGIVVGTAGSATHHHVALPTAATPRPSVVPASPTARPTTPIAPSPPHDVVASAAPTSFEIKGAAFDIKAHVCGMLNIRPLDPPGEQHHTVCWVKEGFGVAPGSSSGTTYVLGHAWAEDDHEVLNALSETAMKQVVDGKPVKISGIDTYPVTALNGYRVTLKTGKGVLTYTVRDAYAVAKNQAGFVQPLMKESTPNRVVIITCGVWKHRDYDYNIVVDAYLSSSVATTTA